MSIRIPLFVFSVSVLIAAGVFAGGSRAGTGSEACGALIVKADSAGVADTVRSGGEFPQLTTFDVDSSTTDYSIEEIVVYGRRIESPSMVTEITGEDAGSYNATNVADVIRFDPGISATSGPKAETEVKIRGFPARSVLVLVDGRPVNTGYYGKVDLSMLPIESIAKIKVVKGPSSVAYGANSMGGVVNIITKNGYETPRTTLNTKFGEDGFRSLSLGHGARMGKFNYLLSGYEYYTDGFRLSGDFEPTSIEDGGLRDNSGFHKAGATLKLGYRPSEDGLYALSLGYHWSEREIPATVYSWDSPTFRFFPDWTRFGAALSARRFIAEKIEITSNIYADSQRDRLIDYIDQQMYEERINWDSKLENWTVGGSAGARAEIGEVHRVRGGLDFKRDLMNKKPDTGDDWYSHHIHTGGAFLEDRLKLWESGEITLGAGYNLYSTEKESSYKAAFGPMAAARQKLPLGLEARASVSRSVRFPTLHHLYSESSGNPELLPEEAVKFEAGAERWILFGPEGHIAMEGAYFYNDLTNLIYRSSRSYRYNNIGEARIAGVELRLDWSLPPYFSGVISYGILDRGVTAEELLEEVAPRKAEVSLSARTAFGTEFNYRFAAFDRRSTYISDRYLEAYSVHNLNAEQRVGEHVRLRIELNNILDEDFEDELGFPAPGRQVMAGVKVAM